MVDACQAAILFSHVCFTGTNTSCNIHLGHGNLFRITISFILYLRSHIWHILYMQLHPPGVLAIGSSMKLITPIISILTLRERERETTTEGQRDSERQATTN